MKFLVSILPILLLTVCAFAQDSIAIDSTQMSSSVLDSLSVSNEDSLNVVNAVMDSLQIASKDSTLIANQLKSEGNRQVQENLGSAIPKDSTELANELERQSLNKLNEEIGINVNGIPNDSATVANEARSLGKSRLNEEVGVDVPDIKMNSTAKDQIKNEAAKQAESSIQSTNEFQSLGGEGTVMEGFSPEQLKQMEARKELKQKMASQAKDFISEHSEQIQEVHDQMSELKQKYSEVPDSKDLSSATKRTSLKGEPLSKRLVFGSNFNLTGTNPVTMDFSPVLGYKINKLFQIGVSGTYRSTFGTSTVSNTNNTTEGEPVYGYSVFANHEVFKNFFGYLEGENISMVAGTYENNSRKWKQSLLLGIGRKLKISQMIELQVIAAYNFLHDNTEGIYNNPIVLKTGFRIGK